MPKKTKIVQTKNQAPPEAAGSRPRRATTSRKKAGTGAKKVATAQGALSMPPEAGVSAEPTDEQIRLRAYFISERRRRFALPGDAESDWLEAKRQLVSEAGRR